MSPFRGRLLAALLVALLPEAHAAAQGTDELYGEDVESAQRYLVRGELGRARALCDEVLADWESMRGSDDAPRPETAAACRAMLLEIDLRQGDYPAVVAASDQLPAELASSTAVRLRLCEALTRTGDYERAERELRDLATRSDGAASVEAQVRLGELLLETGRREEGRARLDGVAAAIGPEATPEVRYLAARALTKLGGRRNIERASVLLRDVIQADPDHAPSRVLFAELRFVAFGEWEGAESGESLLQDVLERNGEVEEALVLLYRIRSINIRLDPARTAEYLERALGVNPRSVPALLEKGVSLIDDRRFQEGTAVLDQALRVNPRDKRVLAQRAVVAALRGDDDGARRFRELAMAVDPGFDGVDVAFGDRLVSLYRFGDAVEHYERARQRDPADVDAIEGLAKALIYSGRGEDGQKLLLRARELEPGYVDPWRNNMIAVQELLDEEYERVEREGFVFLLHRADREVLERYLVPYEEEARRVLGAKYGLIPEERTRVEVLHRWDDFSVRTIGFRGFTALGACFGPFITLVSPQDPDLRRNDFMWTATVWHEYTHVLTLALSAHRVPRWLTEGFSVHEERARNPAWERGMDRELLDAWHNGQIPPVRLMNQLFRGPRILFGYYLGGQIVTYLSDTYGFDKVLALLRGYAQDRSSEQIVEDVLGFDTEELDRRFRAWLWKQHLAELRIVPRFDGASVDRMFVQIARDPDDVESHVKLAWHFVQRGVLVDAAAHVREVVRRDPEHPEIQLVRAEMRRQEGRLPEAAALYEKGFAAGADDFDSRIRYADILRQQGDRDGAIQQLQLAKRCWPDCTDQGTAPELVLARLYEEMGRTAEAMMELRTFCRRTARAFAPRRQLAAFARDAGDRAQEAELLDEAVQIDPFVRDVHVRLGDAYVALGRLQDAVRELEVALAVLPELDRDQLGKPPTEVLRADSPEFLASQAEVRVTLAGVLRRLGREDRARDQLESALREAPDSDAAERARRLLER
ncbi:MAG: tetratricopeptide repeat protein [Planctomycetes bacterium]|nr:tetratricopeptide repeat protein [Planctomycetota bacterium]